MTVAIGTVRLVAAAPTGVVAAHHHVWVLVEVPNAALGRTEHWFQCESCGTPHS